jgi:CHAT domain
MEALRTLALAVEHIEGSSPEAFRLTHIHDGKSLPPVEIASPYQFPVEGRPDRLMHDLRWYLERFLDYPFPPDTERAEHVLDALRAWGTQAFNALFDRPHAADWRASLTLLQVRADDPHVLSWPWEALYDPGVGGYLAHRLHLERRLSGIPDPLPVADLPNDRVNILMVVCRPYEHDMRYRSIARPLIEMIQSKNLPARVDVLRPPTFDHLREHLHQHPGYYHVLHFDGHGTYVRRGSRSSSDQFQARGGSLIFESENGEPDARSARDLSALLHEYAVPAVVVNASHSATLDDQAEDAFATVATALIKGGVRSVVAMAYSPYISGMQVFLQAFYRRLFETGSVAEGVRAGRNKMLANQERMSVRGPYTLQDWLEPVLYQHEPIEFDFVRHASSEARIARLPLEVLERGGADAFV